LLEVRIEESRLPGESMRGAIKYLEGLLWYLYTRDTEGGVCLFRGDRPIFTADSREAVDAFVLGATLAYRSLPEPMFKQYQEHLERSMTRPTDRPSIPGLTPL
jgi:hypothetical protein